MASGLARSMCSSCRPLLAGFTRLEMGVAQGLPELVELPVVNSKLVQDSVEEGRTDLPSTVNWDRGGASVWMPPSFVAPGLARLQKTEPGRDAAEFVGPGARHAQSRWCRLVRAGSVPRTLPKSTEIWWRVQPGHL